MLAYFAKLGVVEKRQLLDNYVTFLCSKQRAVPKLVMVFARLWPRWKRKEIKRIKEFIDENDPLIYEDRLDGPMLMRRLILYVSDSRRVARNMIQLKDCDGWTFDEQLYNFGCHADNYLLSVAIDAKDYAIRKYAMSKIFDLKVLKQMARSEDTTLVKLAKEQIHNIEEVKNLLNN